MAMANCNMCGVWVDLDYADGYTEIAGQFVCEDCVLEREDETELERTNRILDGASEYWQETALAHRRLLREILEDTPHQHVKAEISTHLKQYEGDTDER